MASAAAPLLAHVTRGEVSESRHHGCIAVTDLEGNVRWRLGDIDGTVAYFRSSSKPLQAVPLVESGAADAFQLTDREVAIACGSHSGEDVHVETVRGMLSRGGFAVTDLLCAEPDRAAAAAAGDPDAELQILRHNCSGKHAGMLLSCRHNDWPAAAYTAADHPLQEWIHRVHADFCGVQPAELAVGVDGCSVPCFATSIRRMAMAFARLAEPDFWSEHGDERRATTVRRLRDAMMTQPLMVSGTNGWDTVLMEAAPGRVCCKGGAESVWCFGFPGQALGLAFKVEDGSFRPKSEITVEALRQTGLLPAAAVDAYAERLLEPVRNVRGDAVGEIVAEFELERVAG